jgi:hypothetical protein
MDPQAVAKGMGRDPDESRPCSCNAFQTGGRDGAARRSRCRVSRSPEGKFPQALAAALGLTHKNLGLGLWRLGERESGTEALPKAVEAYREALKEYTRERVPFRWAESRTRDARPEKESAEADRGGDRGLSRGRRDLRKGAGRMGRGQDESRSCSRNTRGAETGTERREEAVAAYREALQELDEKRMPDHWRMARGNLDHALILIAQRKAHAGSSAGR